MPEGVLTGDLKNWKGFFRRERAGLVEARDTLIDIYAAAKKLGVSFITGENEGWVEELLRNGDRIVGAKTRDWMERNTSPTPQSWQPEPQAPHSLTSRNSFDPRRGHWPTYR
jgi:sarcosine oxidase/L-pipecolate oxidase